MADMDEQVVVVSVRAAAPKGKAHHIPIPENDQSTASEVSFPDADQGGPADALTWRASLKGPAQHRRPATGAPPATRRGDSHQVRPADVGDVGLTAG
jgi:hypothetical protein